MGLAAALGLGDGVSDPWQEGWNAGFAAGIKEGSKIASESVQEVLSETLPLFIEAQVAKRLPRKGTIEAKQMMLTKALLILADEPRIRGKELAKRLGCSEATASRIKRKLAGMADKVAAHRKEALRSVIRAHAGENYLDPADPASLDE